MTESTTATMGWDVGDKFTDVCVLGVESAILEQQRVRTTKHSLEKQLSRHRATRVVFESRRQTGPMQWCWPGVDDSIRRSSPWFATEAGPRSSSSCVCGRGTCSSPRGPKKRISKAGDPFLRRLLVQCAHHILGPFGQESDLRRWGPRLAERGGNAAKKKALVAVARKLAVLLHRLWVSGKDYRSIGYGAKVVA